MIQHKLTCSGPRISVQTGVNRDLWTCRACSASVYVQRRP